MTDKDTKTDFEEAYAAGQSHWSLYWLEAQRDIQFREGNEWTQKDKNYLTAMDREALSFRKPHRIVNVIAGYEQKNLYALKIDPFEGADEKTASQFSGLVMNNMLFGGGYMCQSGAFEFGSVIAGMNLIEPWVDRSDDLLNGDIRFRRLPYNRYILDPTFTDRDLDRDCGYVITRDFFSRDAVAGLLPEREKDIERIKGGASDSKFSYSYPLKGKNNEYNLKYDRFYVSTHRPYRILADTQTGRIVPMPDKGDRRVDELIRLFAQRYPQLKVIKGRKRGVDLHIFVEGELMYSGPDPTGLDEYPFVLEAGYWTPEDENPQYRLQGVVRCMRDPATESNRRRSMMLDMLDGVIRQGWKAKTGSVVNQDELYGTGSAVVWLGKDAQMTDVERLESPQIPPGVFQAIEVMDRDVDSVAGVNSEMLGSPEDSNVEVAAVLAKLRSANGLTTLQGLFNGHRFSRILLGRKQVKIIQKNYTPTKVQRILGEPPTREFYTKDFAKYDCVPVEAVLTDSQRQLFYSQLMAYKKMGAPIPWNAMVDYGPMEYKDKFKQIMTQAEKQQSEAAEEERQMNMVAKQLLNAEAAQKIASAKERLSQAQENRTTSELDRAKTIRELQQVDLNSFAKTLALLQQMLGMLKGEQRQPEGGQPGLENIQTIGQA
jgi:hypothetical protein